MSSQENSTTNDEGLGRLFDLLKEDTPPARPEWYAATQRKLGAARPFKGTTYTEMQVFVLGNTGISPGEFDRGSPKSLQSLFAELKREVNLALNTTSTVTRQIERVSSNALGVVWDPGSNLYLHEVGRKILESGASIDHDEPRPFGIRETSLRKKRIREGVYVEEAPLHTLQRGGLEEPGIGIPREKLVPLTDPDRPLVADHDSTVYRCNAIDEKGNLKLLIRSTVVSHVFLFNISTMGLTKDTWAEACVRVSQQGERLLIEDEGVLLLYEWRPLKDLLVTRMINRAAARTFEQFARSAT